MTNDDVRELKHILIDGFARIEKRLDTHDTRFDAIERRLEGHDARFDAHDARFDAHDGRFDALERLIYAKTDEMMEYTELKVGELRREMQAGFSGVDARFAVLEQRLAEK